MPGELPDWTRIVAGIYREDVGRVLASLIRLLGSFELAEEALHDAFAAALEQWPARGLPDSPWRWLVSAGRFRAIDRIRRLLQSSRATAWSDTSSTQNSAVLQTTMPLAVAARRSMLSRPMP